MNGETRADLPPPENGPALQELWVYLATEPLLWADRDAGRLSARAFRGKSAPPARPCSIRC